MSATPPESRRTLGPGSSLALVTGAALLALAVLATCLLGARSALRRELERSGAVSLSLLAPGLAARAAAGDRPAIEETATAAVRGSPEIAYLLVRDAGGAVLGAAFAERLARLDPSSLPPPGSSPGTPVSLGEHPVAAFATPLGPPGAGATLELGLFAAGLDAGLAGIALRASALLALLLAGLFGFSRLAGAALARRTRSLAAAAAQIARGDLSRALPVEGGDLLAELGRSFGETAGSLRAVVVDLRATAQSVEIEARSLLETSARQSQLASQHSEELIDAALTIGEIASGAQLASEQADSVISGTGRSEAMILSGTRSVEDTRRAMEQLAEQVEAIVASIGLLVDSTAEIASIVSTVQELAEQSNLLALNASIEAARAGESGQGFAVVALEMRNLANQSKSEAAQIRALLTSLHLVTRGAVDAAREGSARAAAGIAVAQTARSAIDGLAGVIGESSEAARTIAAQSRAQGDGVQQVALLLNDLSSAMKQSLEQAESIEAVAGNLSAQSSGLTRLTERYRV